MLVPWPRWWNKLWLVIGSTSFSPSLPFPTIRWDPESWVVILIAYQNGSSFIRLLIWSVKDWMDMDRRIDNIHSMIINASYPWNDYSIKCQKIYRDLIIQSWLNLWATLYKKSSDIKCLENSPGFEENICIKLTIQVPLLLATACDLRAWWGSKLNFLGLQEINKKTVPRHQPSFRVASNSKAMQRRNEIASRAKTYCAIALPHDEWSRSDPADPGDRLDWDSLRWLWSLMVPRVAHVEIRFLMDELWQADFWRCEFGLSILKQSSKPRSKRSISSIWNAVRLFETWSCSPSTHAKCPHLAMMISWHHMAFRAERDNRHMWGMKCIKHMKCAIPLEIFSWIPYTFNLMVRRLWTQRTATVFPNVSFGTVLGRLDLDILTILCAIAAICKFRRPCLAQWDVCPFEAWKAWNWKETQPLCMANP